VSGLDRRALGVLGLGHLSADFCQGALPALLPFLAAERGWSYGALGALMLASTIGSSIVQPLFGLASDRLTRPWFMPLGVLTAGLGLAAVGLVSSYPLTALAVAVGGLGVAAFHPEAARYANLASGSRRGRGMSLFSLGGNAGFALGPALATPLMLAFGLTGTVGLAVLPAAAAVLTALNLDELRSTGLRDLGDHAGPPPRERNAWGPFARLIGVVGLRSALYFGLQTLVPLYFVAVLGSSRVIGNTALTVMLLAGAVGTLVGGLLVDRLGPRLVMVGSMALLVPLAAGFPLAGPEVAFALLACLGFVAISNFSVTIVLGQDYLPTRLGLAAGVTVGLAIGLGGVAAAGLGWLADRTDLETAMWVVAALPVPALLVALTLPPGRPARAATSSQVALSPP
jgi:FSR family fosmidomycin resistance protein-like MFS transporter